MMVYHPSGMATVGSEQWICLRLLPRNGRQSNQYRPGISDAVLAVAAAAAAATVYPLAERTRDHNHGYGISILPGVIR